MSFPYKGPGPMEWKPEEQYDISMEEKRRILERTKIRDENRLEFEKKMYNPYINNINFEKPWDPAVERYHAMLAARSKYFKPNWKTFMYVAPPVLSLWGIIFAMTYYSRHDFERDCASGKILYKDRRNKY
ncbi:unnamed protein product [Gordionus sp. m RMFG-2023]